jgi:hypothetical protein
MHNKQKLIDKALRFFSLSLLLLLFVETWTNFRSYLIHVYDLNTQLIAKKDVQSCTYCGL